MTLWKISLVECVQHVHMLELRNWRSFQEELPSFVLLCSSTMSFHRMLTLFEAVLNWVLLTITTLFDTLWTVVSPGWMLHYRRRETTASDCLLFHRACASTWRLHQKHQMTSLDSQEKLAFLRSNNVTAMRTSKSNRFSKQNNNFAFASLFFCMTMRWPKFISLSELGHVCRNIKLQFSLPTFDKVIV